MPTMTYNNIAYVILLYMYNTCILSNIKTLGNLFVSKSILALKLPLESWSYFVTKISSHSSLQSAAVWLVQLFSDQDDDLVSLLFSLLQLYQQLFYNERYVHIILTRS